MRAAVVGGGIAGLAAAWELAASGAEVTVFEPGRVGGRIRTSGFLGRPVDEGADAFLTRVPEGVALCDELGLAAELVAPAAGRAMLWWGGRLRPLPDGLVLGAPKRLGGVARSGLLSPRGIARAGLDVVLPRRGGTTADVSVWELVASRFGSEVAARLVDPLVGGIHAGRTEALSAAATAPQLLAASRRSRSLLRGLRTAPAALDGPVFLTPRGGMGALVDRLVERLASLGVVIEARRVRTVSGRAGRLEVDGDGFDGVVVAVPTAEAAAVVGAAAETAAAGLRGIDYASVVLTTLAWPTEALPVPPGVNGFLVPRPAGRLMTAGSFASAKWPHWSEPGTAVVRLSAGRHLDTRAMDLPDDGLVEQLSAELGAALATTLPVPVAQRVSRWPASFPQYGVGHLDRVAAIEASLALDLPGVVLAGAGYRGSGVPACIGTGRRAARRLLEGVAGA